MLRRKSPDASVVFLVAPSLNVMVRTALKRYGEVVPAYDDVDHVLTRCKEIIRLRNVAEETGERLKSLSTLNRLVDFPMPTAIDARPRVLIAGAPGTAGLSALNAASSIAEQCFCVLTPSQAMRALEHEDFDCVVFTPTEENDPMLALGRTFRRHPRHSHLALIQLAEHSADLSNYARKGARDFVLTGHIQSELPGKIQIASRRARLMQSMRKFLNSCTGEAIRDQRSGVFTSLFLTEHGNRLCARAEQTGRRLSLTLIKLSRNEHDHYDNQSLHHIARMINCVTRAEDMAARIARDKFLLLSPSTTLEDAQKIGVRVSGVLSNTAFRTKHSPTPIAISTSTYSHQHRYGARIEEEVAHVIKHSERSEKKLRG